MSDWDDNKPKSPKSPKPTLENPLLKNPQAFMTAAAPSLEPIRSPLMPMNLNDHQKRKKTSSTTTTNNNNRSSMMNKTPGPPPKASYSLTGTIPSINNVSQEKNGHDHLLFWDGRLLKNSMLSDSQFLYFIYSPHPFFFF